MKNKIFLSVLLGGMGFGAYLGYGVVDFSIGNTVYVRKAENFRDEPQGARLGTLEKGTAVTVVEDSPNWVKVRLEGWIWKESLVATKVGLASGAVRAKQIVVRQLSTAQDILKQLKVGGVFEELAKKHSIGPAAHKGGDLGYFQKGDFAQDFETAIFALKPGALSDIIKSAAGYHIFKRVE
ncbi:peptidylprolyl isomerase [bacterium]|nr:peptidylprolyl isomerase [bacterium]